MISITTNWEDNTENPDESFVNLRIETATGKHFARLECSELCTDEAVDKILCKIEELLNKEHQDMMFVMGQSGG